MLKDDGIVKPVKGKNPPDPKPVALMVSSRADLDCICGLMDIRDDQSRGLHYSRHFSPIRPEYNFSITGPFAGAPYAVMLLETLAVWGADKIIFYGWCGAVSDSVKIGDIIVATSAFVDEGTSKHYGYNEISGNGVAMPSFDLTETVKGLLRQSGIIFNEGSVWSTDAIYRETPEKIACYKGKNALGVEMELSAIYSAAAFRNIEAAGVLVVSDEISTLTWRPGFKDTRFRESRTTACGALIKICQSL
ncbi:MAG: Purine-nucleoside phosphorylase [Thermodesulfobacteriota bacterium]|nr:Purine-nucleoside phosphorylase [Thermodesulfobacteriota bacterium]